MRKIILLFLIVDCQAGRLLLEESRLCDRCRTEFLFLITPKTKNPPQLFEVNATLPKDIGTNTKVKLIFEKLAGTKWMRFFSMTDKDGMCHYLNFYLGEITYDIQNAMGIKPKTCPIPRGTYYVDNVKLDFTKFPIQTLPFGKFKVISETYDKHTDRCLMCSEVIVSYSK